MKKLFRKEVQSVEVGNLVNIKGYPAGEGYYRFVSLVPELAPVVLIDNRGVRRAIRSMICTATVPTGSELYNKLLEECAKKEDCQDPQLLASKIILVSKEFMKLPNKQQLALLNIEFEKTLSLGEGLSNISKEIPEYSKTSVEQQIGADLATIEIYGKRVFKKATKKATKITRKCELKAGKVLHKEYVKSVKAAARMEKEEAKKESVLESAATDENAKQKKKHVKIKDKKPQSFDTLKSMTEGDMEPQGC